MEAPTWCKELADPKETHFFTLGEARAFDWNRDIDRLCSVMWFKVTGTNGGVTRIMYHVGPPSSATRVTHRRTIQIGSRGDMIDSVRLKPIYASIASAFKAANICAFTLEIEGFTTFWPIKHMKSLKISGKGLRLRTCCAYSDGLSALVNKPEIDIADFAVMEQFLKTRKRWLDDQNPGDCKRKAEEKEEKRPMKKMLKEEPADS